MNKESRSLSATLVSCHDGDERPLHAELFTTDQAVQHARALAGMHRFDQHSGPGCLLKRAAANVSVIARVCGSVAAALGDGRDATPAARLLLDQAGLVDEQVALVRRGLPRRAARRLPRLANEEVAGVPRVYQLALEMVAHSDARIDTDSMCAFISAYQETVVLGDAELRALADMLRLALIEHLRRFAVGIESDAAASALAGKWAGRITEAAQQGPEHMIVAVADMARAAPPMTGCFVAGLARQLQGQDAGLAMQWLTSRLAGMDTTLEQMVQAEIAHQAATAISIANAGRSLRVLATVDWPRLAARLSVVERELAADPDGTYPRMDSATRTMYRAKVAAFAGKSGRTELEAAQAALALAHELREPAEGGLDPRTRHVGHYLVGEGAPLLARRLGLPPAAPPRRRNIRLWSFLGAIFAFTALFTIAAMDRARDSALGELLAVAFTLVFALGASQLAVALVNFFASQLTKPAVLPRLDFSDGVPDDAQALVVVPAVLHTAPEVRALCDALELHFIGNRDPNLRFCLLADFADADAQHVPGDAELLGLARQRIDALNERHASDHSATAHDEDGNEVVRPRRVLPFMLLHRARRWNPGQGVWMGHERKRGRLADLNAFLHGARNVFDTVVGDTNRLAEVRYVITLGPDTLLPRGAAGRLVATMAHPLNQAQVAADGSRVLSGHGILQPRMTALLSTRPASRYEELCGGGHGAPDVYQDLFGEGSFAGEGIHDVDAARRVLGNRLPDNVLLSHDLLEGCYLRAGVLADQQMFAPCPTRYSADVSRRYRQVRGDWQLAGWLRSTVPGPDGARVPNPLTPLSRWKVFDKLRHSLVAPAFTALLVMSWQAIPVDWFWTAAVMAAIFVPPLLAAMFNLIEKPHGASWSRHASAVWHGAARSIAQAALALAFLPYEAFMNLDAIARTGWRMLVSRRRLLEWRPSTLARSSSNLHSNARNMWFAPLLAVVCAVALQLSNPESLLLAGPFLLAWLLSPLVAWWVSLPLPQAAAGLAPDDARFLHKLARRTWCSFEQSASADSNWLAPDASREPPTQGMAPTTSPESIGLSLLSNLAAWDFGYLTTSQLALRCAGTLATMMQMERYRGHLFQRYDTLTLEPLLPRYVSSAASGALAGHLLTLAQGLEQAVDAPLMGERAFEGVATTLDIVEDHARGASASIRDTLAAMRAELRHGSERAGRDTLPGFAERLAQLCRYAGEMAAAAAQGDAGLSGWCERLRAQCASFREELGQLAPWAGRADQYLLDSHLTRMPTLRELAAFTLAPPAGDERSASLARLVEDGRERAAACIAQIEALARDARAAAQMDFSFLYVESTRLLSAGYDVSERRLDERCHEVLASAGRLASFVAIAQGQVPDLHWTAMARQLPQGSAAAADCLRPLLVMPVCHGTLLDKACRTAARELAADAGLRRSSKGVPARELAPATAMLGLMVEAEAATRKLQRSAGRSSELPECSSGGAAEGAGLVALCQLLCGHPMQRRFAADPQLRATLPLLQEPVPRTGMAGRRDVSTDRAVPAMEDASGHARVITRTVTAAPLVHLLSNSRYHVMLSSVGGGYSRWNGAAVTRWREDATRDNHGSFCYVRDIDSGEVWSTTYQPTLVRPDSYEASFKEGCARFRRHDDGIDLETGVAVSPDDDVEVRRTRIINNSGGTRTLELTSYVEVALAGHPDPASLMQAEILAGEHALLCRPLGARPHEGAPCMLHLARFDGTFAGKVSFETRRGTFIGRGNDTRLPQAMRISGPLLGTGGLVRDAALAIRCRLVLGPGESSTVDYVSGVADSREGARRLVARYQDRTLADRVFDHARAYAHAVLRQLDANDTAAQAYAGLAAHLLYAQAAMRGEPSALAQDRRGRHGLLAYGISADLPLVLLMVRGDEGIALARQLAQAHAYWRMKGLEADLLVCCPAGCAPVTLAGAGRGGIYVRAWEQLPEDDQQLMLASARVVIDEARGPLADQVAQAFRDARQYPPTGPEPGAPPVPDPQATLALPDLQLSNGYGGFARDGREYVIRTSAVTRTPARWTNLLANPSFGSIVSECGQASTWSGKADQLQLTPGGDDPAIDATGEAFYIRDEQSGRYWSPAPLPAAGEGDYITRHGFGYSVFEHVQGGIHSEMAVYVAPDAALKYTVIRVRNDGAALRRLSVTGYVEWVLGGHHGRDAMHIVTELDEASGALFARHPSNQEFGGRAAFFHLNAQIRTVTGDRTEFIGRTRSLASPAAMLRRRLSGRVGSALDPCAAFCAPFALRPGEQRELVFVLGVGGRRSADAAHVVETCGSSDAARRALDRVRQHWDRLLGAVQVRTPDPALDLMANGWLAYQAISACLCGRTACGEPDFLADLLARFGELAGVDGEAGFAQACSGQAGPPATAASDCRSTLGAIRTAMDLARQGDSRHAWQLLRMLNPAVLAATAEAARRYRAAPYVAAAYIRELAPDTGSGAGPWYAGPACAMYLLIIESLLGVRVEEGTLTLAPLLPPGWDGFCARYRYGTSLYVIDVRRAGQSSLALDGRPLDAGALVLADDGAEHRVDWAIGS